MEYPVEVLLKLNVNILQARLSIIDLLLIGLDKPAPSLSHFLLGFDLKKQPSVGGHGVARSGLPDLSPLKMCLPILHSTNFCPNGRSTLHAPGGVLGAVRTPLHAVLGILRPEAGGGNPAASLTSRPRLCEAAYRCVLNVYIKLIQTSRGHQNKSSVLVSGPHTLFHFMFALVFIFRLLYVLAANPQTSEPTLRYLR